MRIVALSDTHGKHSLLDLPDGDVLLHAGDVSGRGQKHEVLDFLEWFSSQKHTYKVFTPGNHDFFFQEASHDEIMACIPNNVTYLNDSGTTIDGHVFWGSPITPWFFDWAFNRLRGEEITKHWALIPENVDVLITHGPPKAVLDKTIDGDLTGCEDLLDRVRIVEPRYHIFGHIHESYGEFRSGHTTFMNVSILDEYYQVRNQPVVFDFTQSEV